MPETYPQRRFKLPPDATEILLIRHGQSQAAVPDQPFALLDGHADPPLSDVGHEQARALATRLADEPLSALFVSNLQRTGQTAEPLAERTGLEPTVIPDLREVMLGEWEGGEFRIRVANGDPLVAKLFAEERWDVIPGAETMQQFGARVHRGLAQIVEQTGPGNVGAAVLHGGVIAEACHQITGSRPFAFQSVDNASITRAVRFATGQWLLRGFNDSAHLTSLNGGPSASPTDPAEEVHRAESAPRS